VAPCEDSRLGFNPRAGNPTLLTNAGFTSGLVSGLVTFSIYLSDILRVTIDAQRHGGISNDKTLTLLLPPFLIYGKRACSFKFEEIAADADVARFSLDCVLRGAGGMNLRTIAITGEITPPPVPVTRCFPDFSR